MAESGRSPDGEIRKLRKKLRQIENLEHLPRTLTEEEAIKVTQKCELRRRLAGLLRALAEREGDPEPPAPATSTTTPLVAAPDPATATTTPLVAAPNPATATTTPLVAAPDPATATTTPLVAAPDPATATTTPPDAEPTPRHDGGDGMKRTSGTRGSAHVAPETACAPAKQPKQEARSEGTPEKTRAGQTAKEAGTRPTAMTAPAVVSAAAKKEVEPVAPAGLRRLRERWGNARFAVTPLVGHSDLVTAVAFHGSYIVSGSRDTTVKLWHAATGTEEANLGGHTGSVTCVAIAPAATATAIGKALDCADDEDFLASGSSDCTVKIWSLRTGQEVRSVYTYSPVSAIAFLPEPGLLLSASDGGKLDMWDLTTGASVQSFRAHEDAITCLQVRVWELRPGPRLHLLFCTEGEEWSADGRRRGASPLRCLLAGPRPHGRLLYSADEGASIRVLDWRTGSILRKLPNHNSDCGFTDCLSMASDGGDGGTRLMLSAGYDIDRGHGYINVRLLAEGGEPYVATLGGEATPRLLCVATTCTPSGLQRWGTGGRSLLLWEELPHGGGANSHHRENGHVVASSFRREFERDEEVWSDDESSASDSSLGSSSRASSSEDDTEPVNGRRRTWCSVM
ncbi:probable serine/threonine-protein kinase PkwA isoform X2 [Lethenteron reissneri]|uniref:probable serine/threonine-protein kinase PkwA isoform X2 n=1 Tax=Lethenteron reissneri TaxID=7753 RepID=UPI002AB65F58|nr:probable serine/threonine-protein kinase PkwA isoform X2 [Lethenteron reissneri]